jgi:hypothetical protein
MYLDSPHWNFQDGVCTKHHLPSVPCPACCHDWEDVTAVLDGYEVTLLGEDESPRDLCPIGFTGEIRFC